MENELAYYISQGVGGGDSVMDKRHEFYRNNRPVGESTDTYRRLYFMDLLNLTETSLSTQDLEAEYFAGFGYERAAGFAAAYVGTIPLVADTASWPDATNSGYQGNPGDLISTSGRVINTADTIIEGEDILDALIIQAPRVTVRNCILRGGFYGIDTTDAADDLLIEDCTFIGGSDSSLALVAVLNPIVRRCDFSGGQDAIKIAATNGLIQDNYIHDLLEGAEIHNDGIQVTGAAGIDIIHNYISSRDTSSIAMFAGQGTYDSVTIQNNYLTGDTGTPPGYNIYAGGVDGTNIVVDGNTFGNWGFGPVTEWAPAGVGNAWTNNVRDAANGGGEVTP